MPAAPHKYLGRGTSTPDVVGWVKAKLLRETCSLGEGRVDTLDQCNRNNMSQIRNLMCT